MQSDNGQWQPAPFYDVTYSPHPFGEHATSFAGFGKQPPLKALQKLAESAGFARWPIAEQVIKELIEVVSGFNKVANSLDIHPQTRSLIAEQINASCKHVSTVFKKVKV